MTTPRQPLNLRNTFVRLTRDQRLKMVVVGNSVTHGSPVDKEGDVNPSFYVALGEWFTKTFPDAEIEVVPKIIFAIGPEVQVFRMDERVVPEKPDLVLVEFNAANAAWGAPGRHITEPATEGYIRRMQMVMPETDCLMELAYFETMLADYRAGAMPASGAFLQAVAGHYGCVYADAASSLAGHLLAGEDFSTYMNDGIHPSDAGYRIYSDVLIHEVERQWQLFQELPESERVISPHVLPETMLTPDPWIYPRFVPADQAIYDSLFRFETCGKVKYAVAERPHATGFLEPKAPGRVVGYLMRNPGKLGRLEVRVDRKWAPIFDHRGPNFTHGDDPDNLYYRDFFGAYDMPMHLPKFGFCVSSQPGIEGSTRVEIVGFFVLEYPANYMASAQKSDKGQV